MLDEFIRFKNINEYNGASLCLMICNDMQHRTIIKLYIGRKEKEKKTYYQRSNLHIMASSLSNSGVNKIMSFKYLISLSNYD